MGTMSYDSNLQEQSCVHTAEVLLTAGNTRAFTSSRLSYAPALTKVFSPPIALIQLDFTVAPALRLL